MGILKSITEWATSPWGQSVPIHVAWFLIWAAGIAGLLFLTVHAIYVHVISSRAEVFAASDAAVLPAACPGQDSQTFAGGAFVSLDYGCIDVYAALHGIPYPSSVCSSIG